MVGAGAVGGYYGARLWEAGHSVQFYLREPHYSAALAQGGLRVTSVDGDLVVPPSQLHSSVEAIAKEQQQKQQKPVDWIVVSLKSSALDAIPALLVPFLQENSSPTKPRILVIMNGMIEDSLLDQLNHDDFECLYGGMALICSNRVAPAHIDHSYWGLLSVGVAKKSQHTSLEEDPDLEAVRSLWEGTCVPLQTESDLVRGRWKKMIWNLPFNGLSVAMGGITVDRIVQDEGLRQLARAIMEETVAAANAELQLLAAKQGETEQQEQEAPLGETEMAAMMKLSDDMGPYKPSTMLDFVNRRPMEVAYLFREPLDRARRLGVPTPVLETVVTQIEAYQRMYNLF